MPTGSGKSLMYMAAAALTPGRTVALTANLGLQDQIEGDYRSMGLQDMRGQGNYLCKALFYDGEYAHLHDQSKGLPMCDEGPCHVNLPCSLKEVGCEYYDRLRRVRGAPLVSTSYALWLAQKQHSQGLGTVDLLVLDEAHAAEDELARALTIKLDRWLCQAVNLHPPLNYSISQWRDWAVYHANRLKAKLDEMPHSQSGSDMKYRRRLKAAERLLRAMAAMKPGNWIEDSTPDALIFQILHPAQYAEDLLFQGAKKVVLTSATLTAKTLALLGIPQDQALLWECPSRFPVARRPITYVPTVRVDNRMTKAHQQMLYTRVNQSMGVRLDRKGLIHSVSYKRAEQVKQASDTPERLIIPPSGKVTETVLAFKQAPVIPGYPAPWLISPSLSTGWDFPDDTCRVQVVLKMPFPSPSKLLTARSQVDDQYLPYLMIQALVQSVGRGVRHDLDWCETLIFDDHWAWIRFKYKHLIVKWFLDACRESKTLPPPLVVAA
jgi:ATP-dependent DNA helicase DinG